MPTASGFIYRLIKLGRRFRLGVMEDIDMAGQILRFKNETGSPVELWFDPVVHAFDEMTEEIGERLCNRCSCFYPAGGECQKCEYKLEHDYS